MRSISSAYKEDVRPEPVAKEREGPKYLVGSVDYTVFLVTIILVLFGLMMIFSASYNNTGRSMHYDFNPFFYLIRHGMMVAIGFVGMGIMSKFPYRWLKNLAIPSFVISTGLLLIAIFTGEPGRERWIGGSGVQFQPSELAKVALILAIACVIDRKPLTLHKWVGYLYCLGFVGIIAALVLRGGDLGTTVIITIIGCGMIFMASPHIWRFLIAGAAGVAGVYATVVYIATNLYDNPNDDFRIRRILAWLDPFAVERGDGWQIVLSLYAVASGGPFGLGIGQSRQKGIMPEVHHDMIFAIVVEELGFVGAGIILVMFGIIIRRGLLIAVNAIDTFGSMIATGITLMIGVQAIVNVAVITNAFPNTGVPMPFISYGGTFLVVCMGAMGILLNISRHSKI